MAEEITTVQISVKASKMLEALGDTYKRSKKAQAEWLIEQEFEKLAAVKLVAPLPPPNTGEGNASPKSKKSTKA